MSVCVLHVHAISVDVFQKKIYVVQTETNTPVILPDVSVTCQCSICSQVKQCMSILNDVCSSFVLHLE